MTTKKTYFPPTTAQQRKLLFEPWEQTKSVTVACRITHVGRTTFYNWLPKFKEKGYAGLETWAQFVEKRILVNPHEKLPARKPAGEFSSFIIRPSPFP